MNDRPARQRVPGCCFALAIAAGLVTPFAYAQNRLSNANFNSDFSSWNTFLSAVSDNDPAGSGSAARSTAQDVDGGNPITGAASVTLDASAAQARSAAGAHQCVDLGLPAPTVSQANYGARFKIPANATADGSVTAGVEIRFYSDAGCVTFIPGAGGGQGRTIASGVPDDGHWYAATDAGFSPPPGTVARSADVRVTLRRNSASETAYSGFFDAVYLSLNGATPVVLQRFQVD